jgi:lipoprotein NlpI
MLLSLALLFVPVDVAAQLPPGPCFLTSATADQKIVACTALLRSGTLSASNTAFTYSYRGLAYHAKGQEDLAIADYTAALRINANYTDAYNYRGDAYHAKGQEDLAIADYTAALRIDPNSMYADNSRGDAYHAKGQEDLAIADYTAALRIDPNSTYAYYSRGDAYHAKGQEDLAITDYTVALRIDPNSAYAYYSRGDAYHAKGQEDLAIADYSAALRINPDSAYAYQNRGMTFFVVGRFSESVSDFKRRVELRPSNAYAALWLHIARLRSGANDDDFAARSTSLDATEWPAPILALYLGRQTPEQALSAASSADQRCEAAFYVSEWQLWHHEIALAQTGFARALETCPHSYIEYQGARAELARLPK